MTISVTLSNYNHAHYLPAALDALLNQSYPPAEIIITDDASTDNSVEVIEKMIRMSPTVRLIRNERNMGTVHNTNRMFQLASGKYVYSAAADDRVLPGFFEKSARILARRPEAGLCCCDPASFNGATGEMRENRLYLSHEPIYLSPFDVENRMRHKLFPIAGHTSIMKRTALLAAGSLLPELRWHCDWFAVLVIAFRHGICYIPEPLATIRVLPESYSASGTKQWHLQREVLIRMLDMLKTPAYHDVLPVFRNSGVFADFDVQMLRVLSTSAHHRDFMTPLLIRRALWKASFNTAAKMAPDGVKNIVRKMR